MEKQSVYVSLSQSGRLRRWLLQARFAVFHSRTGMIGFIILAIMVGLSVFAPLIFPLDLVSNPATILKPPSAMNWLGTDHLGRDIFAQIANGGRELLVMALITASLGMFIGVVLGSFSAIIGGLLDDILLIIADIWLSIPRLPLLVVISAFIKLNSISFAIILAILSWAGIYRTIRAEVLSLKQRDFIEAAFMQGLSAPHIVFKEITPNLMGFIAVNFTLLMRGSIYSQVGLVFLGILPLDQNWGVMINQAWTQGVLYNKDSIWYILSPTLMICLLIMSLVWVGKALENVFNPSVRK
ncbi:MAG: ABC transporter permease [Clostridiaceae bacterium]